MRKLITVGIMTAALLGTAAQASWVGDDIHARTSNQPGCNHK